MFAISGIYNIVKVYIKIIFLMLHSLEESIIRN